MSDAIEKARAVLAAGYGREVKCARCSGTGIDPVRVEHDPDHCSECGGCAAWCETAGEMAERALPALLDLVEAADAWSKCDVDDMEAWHSALCAIATTKERALSVLREATGGER